MPIQLWPEGKCSHRRLAGRASCTGSRSTAPSAPPHPVWPPGSEEAPGSIFLKQLFGACRRRTPRARSNWRAALERSWRDTSLGTLRSTTGPRRLPSACSEILEKKTRFGHLDPRAFGEVRQFAIPISGRIHLCRMSDCELYRA